MIKYSFIVPIYNDGYLVDQFCIQFERALGEYTRNPDISRSCELIFVNDGSRNESIKDLIAATEKFKFVKAIDLTRNFGHHVALSCGYQHAVGSYVGMLNVDLQDPPDQIPLLLTEIEKGDVDLVLGLRTNDSTSWKERPLSVAFLWLLNILTNTQAPLNVATLRVMSRRFVDVFNSLTERTRYIPGLEDTIGFRRSYIPIRHEKRQVGKSSYTFRRRWRLAVDAVISHSDVPMRFALSTGIAILGLGVVIGIFYLFGLLTGVLAGLASLIALATGAQILVTAFGGLYTVRALREVQNRPLYVIRQSYNLVENKAYVANS